MVAALGFAQGPGVGAWKANGKIKTLATMLRGIANGLSLTYSTCVTVQRALQSQNSDEDTEIGECPRHYVAAPLTRYVEDVRALAKSLHPMPETPP